MSISLRTHYVAMICAVPPTATSSSIWLEERMRCIIGYTMIMSQEDKHFSIAKIKYLNLLAIRHNMMRSSTTTSANKALN
jgi:hypothetical protein